MSPAQTSTILLIGETFCLSPELIPLDKRPIPQSMVLIATLGNILHYQIIIVYSLTFKCLIFFLLINPFLLALFKIRFLFLPQGFGLGFKKTKTKKQFNVRCYVLTGTKGHSLNRWEAFMELHPIHCGT